MSIRIKINPADLFSKAIGIRMGWFYKITGADLGSEILPMPDNLSFNEVDNFFGNVGGMIGDTLKVP
jgi:hypothetical protein